MTFHDVTERGRVAGELKYCERCGGLFVRPPADERVYCARCVMQLAQESLAEGMTSNRPKDRIHKRPKGTTIIRSSVGSNGRIDSLQGVAMWEVRA